MGIKVDTATARVTLFNWALIGLMAATFIVAAKVVLTKFPIKGLTEFFHAV